MLRVTSSSWLVAAKCGSSVPWFAWKTTVRVSLLDLSAGAGEAAADGEDETLAAPMFAVGTTVGGAAWPEPVPLEVAAVACGAAGLPQAAKTADSAIPAPHRNSDFPEIM